jgi:hypothetical protein
LNIKNSRTTSYEGRMLEELKMPNRREVERALLVALFKHNGVIKEFGANEEIVHKIADDFGLNEKQRTAYLETIYRKENRVKKSLLWHRLLFRAADSLAKEKLVSRPTQTLTLTQRREWMLTEKGFGRTLKLLNIPFPQEDSLMTKSFEVQKLVKKLNGLSRPENYDPLDKKKSIKKVTTASSLRSRAFRLAVIEAYNYKCAICGLKICSPDTLSWEVEAAHIVPKKAMGKDDIWNALALCSLHHWAFDVGWISLHDNYRIQISPHADSLPNDFARIGDYQILKPTMDSSRIFLPDKAEIYPHQSAIIWHRNNIFHR